MDKTTEKVILNEKRRKLQGVTRIIAFIIGFILTIITFYTAFQGIFLPMIQRGMHLCLMVALIFLWYPARKNSSKTNPSLIDFLCVIVTLLIFMWTLFNHQRFLLRIPLYSEINFIDKVAGITLVILVLEAGRRTLGMVITLLAGIFILYGFLGPYMPAMLAHPGMSINKFVDQMYLTSEGLFSSLMGISATLLFSFIAFGTFLQGTGADKYYIDICVALTGKQPGGPAKVAVLSSAAMGTISGSSIANVVTTGTLTIPLMKKTGYTPVEAGAIETVASAGGQIMPPIMGTGAFIMAEVLGIRYIDIIKVAIIPAIIFYMSIWFFVDIKARKKGFSGLKSQEIPNLFVSIKKSFLLFLPIIVLVVLLLYNYTPFLAGSLSTLLVLLVSIFKKDTRMSFIKFFLTIEKCAINMTSIAGIIACATIIVGIINITGLMLKSTSVILHLSKGSLPITIILEVIIAYVLGMGLPVATSYIILSTLGAPALMEMGVLPLASHLMIFWFSQLATITPPVCMTAFAAASISGGDPMKTGYASLKMGSPFYFIPILFIYSNILIAPIIGKILIGVAITIGVYFLVCGLEGYYFGKLNYLKRIICLIIFTIFYSSCFNIISIRISGSLILIGIIISIGLSFIQIISSKKVIPNGGICP